MNILFVCTYVMPAVVGFMMVGVVIGLGSLSDEQT